MTLDSSYFIDEILNLEAEGMLADLSVNFNLCIHFMDFEDTDRERALSYIKSVLAECYRSSIIEVATHHENQELYGYAIMFVDPDEKHPKYLHKIFIKEQFRGRGIGTKMLSSIIKNSRVGLLCPAKKIAFYQRNGFEFSQKFGIHDSQDFKLSKGMYMDLCIMKNYNEKINLPIFLLNDKDIRNILGI